MPPEKPRRTLLAVLLVAALGLFASTPSSADEPALPQFDPDSVVELENGLNWIDLNGDGVEDPVVMSRSHRRATFMHFDFYLRDLDPVDGNEWSYIDDGSFHAEEEYGCQEYALRVARRLDRPSGPLTVVIAWRLYDDSTLGVATRDLSSSNSTNLSYSRFTQCRANRTPRLHLPNPTLMAIN